MLYTLLLLSFAICSTFASKQVHVVIMSDRIKGINVVLNSTCVHSTEPNKINFFIITKENAINEIEENFDDIDSCSDASIEINSVKDMTKKLVELGFNPFWSSSSSYIDNSKEIASNDWSISSLYKNEKHYDALNHLRFYIPELLTNVKDGERIIFMDDDIVVQKDIKDLIDFKLEDDKVFSTGCQHWKWNNGEFEMTYDISMLDSKYFGKIEREEIFDELKALDSKIRNIESSNLDLEKTKAFNLGLNIIDIAGWKNKGLTNRYEKWIEHNLKSKLFPVDTLAFGLGIAYLSLYDVFQCYDDTLTHLVGTGFVNEKTLINNGWNIDKIRKDAFAIHYNGNNKPWKNYDCLIDDDVENFKSASQIWNYYCGLKDCPCNINKSLRNSMKNRKLLIEQNEYASSANGISSILSTTILLTATISLKTVFFD